MEIKYSLASWLSVDCASDTLVEHRSQNLFSDLLKSEFFLIWLHVLGQTSTENDGQPRELLSYIEGWSQKVWFTKLSQYEVGT